MRERGFGIRGRGLRAFAARHRALWFLTLGGAALLAGVGAFGTGEEAAAPQVYAYWFAVMLSGGLVAALALEGLEAHPAVRARPALKALGMALVVTLVATPVVWVFSALALQGSWDPGRMAHLAAQVLLVVAVFVPLQLFVDARRPAPARSSPMRSGEALRTRLPHHLRAAELHAVSVEDHYLRFHTSAGSGLVLMSLERALPELQAFGGARTHRSWWVAREAVLGATRGRGRAALHLKNGIRAPVSRSYAPTLRGEGWY